MAQDTLDIVCQQATMVAFCIPGVGPALAALTSIAGALHDSYGKHDQPQRYSMPQAIADLGTSMQQMLVGVENDTLLDAVRGWESETISIHKETKNWVDDDSVAARTVVLNRIAAFEEDLDFNTKLGFFGKDGDDSKSQLRVQNLGNFFHTRTAYHAILQAKLAWITRAFNLPKDQWCHISGDLILKLRTNFVDSHSDACDYAEDTVKMLEDAYEELDTYTEQKIQGVTDPIQRNKLLTKKLRALNQTSHLNFATREQVKHYRVLLQTYGESWKELKKESTNSHWATAIGQTGGGKPASRTITTKLDKRPANCLRVVYETDAGGGWVGVLKNSPLKQSTSNAKVIGPIATQNAGSSDSALYYQTGGSGLNLAFDLALTKSGEQINVNKALKSQYNKKYNNSWATDAKSARQDRLTSFLIPLDPTAQKGGDDVYCMVYSVGPKLSNGITDEAAYQQIYSDAFTELAAHNRAFPPIENFRLTLVSTLLYAGQSDLATLSSHAARLVIQAAKAAATTDSSLANLTLLVNSNETTGGVARVAFDSAATTLGLTPTDEGFYVPLT